jgi:hypothetical protein
MSTELRNRLLEQIATKVEESLTPENRADYDKIVVAGMRYGLEGGPNSVMAQVRTSQDPVKDCALGAVNTVKFLAMQSQGTMPERAMIPASLTLMLLALDFVDRAGIATVGQEEVVRATKLWGNYMFAAQGVTPEKLRRAASQVYGVTQDKGQLEAVKLRAGLVKDPRASTPTELPEEPPPRNRAERRRAAARRA